MARGDGPKLEGVAAASTFPVAPANSRGQPTAAQAAAASAELAALYAALAEKQAAIDHLTHDVKTLTLERARAVVEAGLSPPRAHVDVGTPSGTGARRAAWGRDDDGDAPVKSSGPLLPAGIVRVQVHGVRNLRPPADDADGEYAELRVLLSLYPWALSAARTAWCPYGDDERTRAVWPKDAALTVLSVPACPTSTQPGLQVTVIARHRGADADFLPIASGNLRLGPVIAAAGERTRDWFTLTPEGGHRGGELLPEVRVGVVFIAATALGAASDDDDAGGGGTAAAPGGADPGGRGDEAAAMGECISLLAAATAAAASDAERRLPERAPAPLVSAPATVVFKAGEVPLLCAWKRDPRWLWARLHAAVEVRRLPSPWALVVSVAVARIPAHAEARISEADVTALLAADRAASVGAAALATAPIDAGDVHLAMAAWDGSDAARRPPPALVSRWVLARLVLEVPVPGRRRGVSLGLACASAALASAVPTQPQQPPPPPSPREREPGATPEGRAARTNNWNGKLAPSTNAAAAPAAGSNAALFQAPLLSGGPGAVPRRRGSASRGVGAPAAARAARGAPAPSPPRGAEWRRRAAGATVLRSHGAWRAMKDGAVFYFDSVTGEGTDDCAAIADRRTREALAPDEHEMTSARREAPDEHEMTSARGAGARREELGRAQAAPVAATRAASPSPRPPMPRTHVVIALSSMRRPPVAAPRGAVQGEPLTRMPESKQMPGPPRSARRSGGGSGGSGGAAAAAPAWPRTQTPVRAWDAGGVVAAAAAHSSLRPVPPPRRASSDAGSSARSVESSDGIALLSPPRRKQQLVPRRASLDDTPSRQGAQSPHVEGLRDLMSTFYS